MPSCPSLAIKSRSISIASTFVVLPRSNRVRAPSPGPISTTRSAGCSESASTIFPRTRGSWRKCWPNRRRATCGLLLGGWRESDRKLERLEQAARIGLALAGEVERGAVIDRGAHERQAERDVDAAAEARVLEHRQALV